MTDGTESKDAPTVTPAQKKGKAKARRVGQIIPRGENKWLVRVPLGQDESTGKRATYNKTVRGTKKDADKFLTGVLRQIDLGEFVEPSTITVNGFLDKWLDTMGSRVTAQTLRSYRYLAANHIRPVIGSRKMSSIHAWDIQQVYAEVEKKDLSACTVRHVYNVLTGAFSQAVKWRMLKSNPVKLAELPKETRKEMRPFWPEEAARFLKAAESNGFYALFALALTSGMRPSEYLGLKWEDVDIERGVVTVKRTMQSKIGGGWEFGDTKTPTSKRSIPLPQSTIKALGDHRRKQLEERMRRGHLYRNHDLVFANSDGDPITLDRVRRQFQAVLKAAGLPATIRVYDLRHTCATLLLAAGENPKVISERLGHSSVKMTLDVYSHVLPTMQQGAAEKLEKACFG
jgi:integrase